MVRQLHKHGINEEAADPGMERLMRTLNHLTKLFAFAALVMLGHPDTASAQALTFSGNSIANNTLSVSIAGPGSGAGPITVTVVPTAGGTVTDVCPCNISTQPVSIPWIQTSGFTSGNSFTVTITNTSGLSANTTYNGSVAVNANGNTLS